jgi:hypothetical protein
MFNRLMRVIGYKLVMHHADSVEDEVRALLEKGWQPLGGPVISPAAPHSEQSDEVYQAMVLYEDSKRPPE